MKNINIFIAPIVSLFFFVAPATLHAFYDQPLPALTDSTQHRLQDYSGKILLISLFEPECSWCYKQMKVFNQIVQACNSQLQPLAVGIHGRKKALRREVHRAQAKFPTFQAPPSWLKSVGEVPATPWTLVVDSKGTIVATVRGYFGYEKVQKAFPELCTAAL